MGQGQREDGDADDEYQQDGHHHLGHALDTGIDALIDHEGGGGQENHKPDDGLHGGGNEAAKESVSLCRGGRAAGKIGCQILEDPAADGAVVGQNHHGNNAGDQADPAPLRMNDFIGSDGALCGLSADGDLGGQQSKAKGQSQDNVGQQENTAAVLGCQIRKAPDIAQTDGRACRSQNKTQRTTEITAFLFHNCFSPSKTSRQCGFLHVILLLYHDLTGKAIFYCDKLLAQCDAFQKTKSTACAVLSFGGGEEI